MYEYACDRCKKNLGTDYRGHKNADINLKDSILNEKRYELCDDCYFLLVGTLRNYWDYKPAPTVNSGLAAPEFKKPIWLRFWSWMQT